VNDFSATLLLTYSITTVLKLLLIWFLLKMLDRFANVGLVVLLGLSVCLYHAQAIYRGKLLCDDPLGWVDIPNLPAAVNWVISARDCPAPVGEPIDWVFLNITGPISIAVTAVLVACILLRSRRHSGHAE